MNSGFAYIVSNKTRTTFYIGVTNDIERRIYEHKTGQGSYFTSKYKLTDLVLYEYYENIDSTIEREKQLKNWHREWKINLIKKTNPELVDFTFTDFDFIPEDFVLDEQPRC